jgi:hypothetical protein
LAPALELVELRYCAHVADGSAMALRAAEQSVKIVSY